MRRAALALGIAVSLGALIAVMATRHGRIYSLPHDVVVVPSDDVSITRGKHLIEAVAVCTICHGDDLGGKLAFDDPVLGHGYTPNLTRGKGGIGGRYRTQDWVGSIRYGVRPDGRAIAFMPSDHYNAISDPDLGAMIAYLIRLSPVDNERTGVELNLVARLLISFGAFGEVNRTSRIDFSLPRPTPPTNEGAYLVEVGGCTFCHGPQLKGGQGPEPGAPAAPDLTATGPLRNLSEMEFSALIRNGIAADGHAIQARYMPWLGYRKMTNTELAAIWHFVSCGSAHTADPSCKGK